MAALEDLLRAREAQGLRWGITVRLTVIALGAAMLPATRISVADTVYTSLLLATGAAISIYGYGLARREQRLGRVGWMCLSFDIVTLFTLPVSWYMASGGPGISPSFLMKNDFIPVCLMVIAANGLTLRPAYPLVATGASLLLYAGFLAYGWGDPRVVFDWSVRESLLGPTVHPGLFAWRLATLAFFGGLFSWMAAAGQRTVREAVELELANAEARRRQSELVMQGRLSALAALVAGLAHEINSPLGVIQSCLQTIRSGAAKLATSSAQNERARAAVEESARTAGEAVDRMEGLLRKLKDFSGLDQAEVQEIEVEAALDRTIDLIDPGVRGEAKIERAYGGAGSLRCRSKEIHQAFHTLISNAFEALEGAGALRIGTARRDGRIVVEIADTGRGIGPEELAELFEIRFATKERRVGMRLGLPMARTIVESHGGTIGVESEMGRGTRFEIELPVGRG